MRVSLLDLCHPHPIDQILHYQNLETLRRLFFIKVLVSNQQQICNVVSNSNTAWCSIYWTICFSIFFFGVFMMKMIETHLNRFLKSLIGSKYFFPSKKKFAPIMKGNIYSNYRKNRIQQEWINKCWLQDFCLVKLSMNVPNMGCSMLL